MDRTVRVPEPTWPTSLARRDVDQVLVVLSDVEMGAGGLADDFPETAWLADLLLRYNQGPFAEVPLTVVFNGDTFDLLKTRYHDSWPIHVDESVALGKLQCVFAQHESFLQGISEFLAHRGAERRVAFIAGNHDAELLMPAVQDAIRRRCHPPSDDTVAFPGLSLRVGDVHIEHGSQGDPLFAMEPDAPFISHGGRRLLNLPWGAVALLEVAMPLTPILYHHDRLKPRETLLDVLPELRELLLAMYWRYWTRDYWQKFFAADDPLRRVSWTMLREIVYRFRSGAMDISVFRPYEELLKSSKDVRVCLVGHQHEAAWWSYANKKLLRTGCFRNEFALVDQGRRQEPIPKVYAEVYLRGGRTVRSRLVEVDTPPLPPGYVPDSIFDVREQLENIFAEEGLDQTLVTDRTERRAREAEEARESHGEQRRFWPAAVPVPRTVLGSLRRALGKGEKDRGTESTE